MNVTSLLRPLRAAMLAALAAVALAACTSDRVAEGQCEFDSDCSSGQVCASRMCRAPCRVDADCAAGQRCLAGDRPGTLACVAPPTGSTGCVRDSDCAAGEACLDNRCRPHCQSNYDCQVVNPQSQCVAGACVPQCTVGRADCDGVMPNGCEVDTRSDVRNCSACGRACPAGQVCSGAACRDVCAAGETSCAGSCLRTDADVMHCGRCANACPAPANATATCAAGACGIACLAGFGDCDGDAANGCEAALDTPERCGACATRCGAATPLCTALESGGRACTATPCAGTLCSGACVDTQTDVSHCGACGTACATTGDSTPRCEAGVCRALCTAPAVRADCDGTASNGCEAALATDTANCGACGSRCEAAAHATAACAEATCGLVCEAGYGNCDGMRANGCESDTRADVTSCGRCGNACTAPANATATCAAGACGFACNAGFADCNAMAADGCEVNTQSDRAACGTCGRACAAGEVCSAGVCRSTCAAGETNCAGSCAVLTSSLSHCGVCGRACPSPANATPACTAGACGFTCAAGFGDCDGNGTNGCETSLLTAATSCGRCGNTCALANATAACDGGACVVGRCDAGFADCNGVAADGCEVDTRSSTASCGACGRACAVANATAACASGACVVGRCNAGYADCDRAVMNGCEVNTTTSVSSCGGCGNACSAAGGAATCAMGACGITCAAGRGDCNASVADGCEVDTASATAHCGACGRACALANATPACTAGACAVASCAAGYGNCDGVAANGCEVSTATSVAHCGACGRACALANATPACAAGACAVASCNAGYADCDGVAANGCEVNLNTDPARCGACTNACSTAGGAASCAAGACGITCAAGRGNCNTLVSDGCETNTNTAASHCGACGRACALANATAACTAGACAIASCAAGWGDCDGAASNGCEANLNTDTAHCGACPAACPAGNVCSMGACTLVCAAGLTNCGGRCVSLATSATSCGACSTVCPARANATPTCAAGACGFTCNAGFADCDGAAANGCEVDTSGAVAHCGGCGRACNATGGAAGCAMGACTITCAAGRGDCNAVASDGCEVDTNTAALHCGRCGSACALPNATPACRAGACAIGSCNAGFADCDGVAANGCEVSLTTDPTHCGACATACAFANATAACTSGRCTLGACAAGYGNCDGAAANGCETDTSATVDHCGGCGMACSASHGAPSCAAGACSIVCERTGSFDGAFYYSSFWGNCDGDARANGCETDLLTPSNCQACGNACSFTNGVPACANNSGTQCYLGGCAAGFADCNGTSADGCEVDTTSDRSNCGGCGRVFACGSTRVCRASMCRPGNDACAGATAINLAAGRQLWVPATTANALHDIDPSCRATTSPDVYFSFTLTQRELVYADTFGDGSTAHPTPTWDTVLFFASSCTASMPATGAAGAVYCNDDASGLGCTADGTRSQVSAVLEPGTYYLVLSGYGGASGVADINFQHLPVGNGTAVNLATMGIGSSYSLAGTTAGTGTLAPSAACTANGPEVTYWWRQCSAAGRFSLSASTCNAGSNFDTVLYYRNAYSTVDTCNDDAGSASCPMRATLSITGAYVSGGQGIHAVTVDGFSTSSVGSYVLTLGGYTIIAGSDPPRGVCRDPRRGVVLPRTRASAGAPSPRG
jgi:hypothetical protein